MVRLNVGEIIAMKHCLIGSHSSVCLLIILSPVPLLRVVLGCEGELMLCDKTTSISCAPSLPIMDGGGGGFIQHGPVLKQIVYNTPCRANSQGRFCLAHEVGNSFWGRDLEKLL